MVACSLLPFSSLSHPLFFSFLLSFLPPLLWNICNVKASVIENVIIVLVIYFVKSCEKVVEILQDFIETSQYIQCFLSWYQIVIEYLLCVRQSARGTIHVILFGAPVL